MSAKTPGGRKAKGRMFQQEIREELIRALGIHENDILSTAMGQSGPDIYLSSAARAVFPFAIEAKNQETIKIWQALKQAEAHAKATELHPALIFRRNRTDPWVAIPLTVFLELVKTFKVAQQCNLKGPGVGNL